MIINQGINSIRDVQNHRMGLPTREPSDGAIAKITVFYNMFRNGNVPKRAPKTCNQLMC